MEALTVGDRVIINIYNKTYTGDVAFIFGANKPPTEEDLLKYFGLTPLDRRYRTAAKASKYDRAVIEFKEGHYVVVPVSSTFKGTVQIILRAGLNRYVVRGCRQGYGMDADKFYDVTDKYDAKTIDEARQMASDDGIWVESIQEIDRKEVR